MICNICRKIGDCKFYMIDDAKQSLCYECASLYHTCNLCSRSYLITKSRISDFPFLNRYTYKVCSDCTTTLYKCIECNRYSTQILDYNTCAVCREYTKFLCKLPAFDSSSNDNGSTYLGNRHISFELEIIPKAGVPYVIPDLWQSVYDGSLSSGGIELLNRQPLCGTKAIEAVNNLYSTFVGKYNTNKTCGYHLHLDCTKEDEGTIEKFARFCIQIQDSVAWIVMQHRTAQYFNNGEYRSYCMKLPKIDESQSFEDYIYKKLGGTPSKDKNKYGKKYSNSRYYWWNFHSYFYRMTLECRLYQGTLKPQEILRWAELWIKLFEYIKITPESEYNAETDVLKVAEKASVRSSTVLFFTNRRFQHVADTGQNVYNRHN